VFLSVKNLEKRKKLCQQARIIAAKWAKIAILRAGAQYRNSTKYYVFTPEKANNIFCHVIY